MKWSKYEHYRWTTSNFAKDMIAENNVEDNWYIAPPLHDAPTVGFHQDHELEQLIHYELNADDFNPSAELARVYEIVMHNNGNPPEDYAVMCAKKMFIGGPKGLSKTKQQHNLIHGSMKTYFRQWITDWGELEKDNDQLHLHNYWQLAKNFHGFYTNMKEPTAEQLSDISENIRLHCEVGLMTDPNGHHPTFDVAPKNLRGFLWKLLAEDYENHWQAVQLIHCARPACIRVFGRKRRGQAKACGAACATYISKNKNENQIQSAFSKSQI
jgi:hypothetical protein